MLRPRSSTALFAILLAVATSSAFAFSAVPRCSRNNPRLLTRTALNLRTSQPQPSIPNQWALQMASDNDNDNTAFSQEVQLRAEAESPFQKIRFFFYLALGAGASVGLFISLSRISAAVLGGVNTDLLQESCVNAGVDAAGIALLAYLYNRDLQAQNARQKRAAKGAKLAKLMVRGSAGLLTGDLSSSDDTVVEKGEMFTTSLASLRRGRGIEKRVVIAAAGNAKLQEIVQEAARLEEALMASDLLIVPVLLPDGVAPELDSTETTGLPNCVATPVGRDWKALMGEEADEAASQGVDVIKDGFCVILKKNGRVGQRTKGILLGNMVGEVEERIAMGMDVKNI